MSFQLVVEVRFGLEKIVGLLNYLVSMADLQGLLYAAPLPRSHHE